MENTFGKRLEEVMLEKGFNKNSLAREAKMHASTLKNWIESSTKPDDLKLDTILKILGTTRDYLYTGTGDKFKTDTILKERQIEVAFEKLPINEQVKIIYEQNNQIIKVQKELEEKVEKIVNEKTQEMIEKNEIIEERINDVLFVMNAQMSPLLKFWKLAIEESKSKTVNKIMDKVNN